MPMVHRKVQQERFSTMEPLLKAGRPIRLPACFPGLVEMKVSTSCEGAFGKGGRT